MNLSDRISLVAKAHVAVRMSVAIVRYVEQSLRDAEDDEWALAVALMAVDTAADSLRAVLGTQDRPAVRRVFAKRDALRDLVREAIGIRGEPNARRAFRAERDPGAARPAAGAGAAPGAGGP